MANQNEKKKNIFLGHIGIGPLHIFIHIAESGMCQSFTSVPRTYIRAADELEPFSANSRLASLPSLSPSPVQSPIHYYRHPSLTPHPSRYSPLPNHLPPKALPQAFVKTLTKPSKLPASLSFFFN
jgi:hypothetical protein